MDAQPKPLLLKPEQAAQLLNLSRGRIYQLLKDGSLPSVRIGKALRVPSDSLAEWVESRKTTGGDSSASSSETTSSQQGSALSGEGGQDEPK